VSPVSRRIFLYWVLLLVPTLVVGAAAVLLLRREQGRLAQQGVYADETRRAALTARAQLIAENVELLTGDVENGLLDTLSEAPVARLDAFLDEWEKTNPLVRTTFRASAEGRLLRPTSGGVDAGEDARGFLRRFGTLLRTQPPWRVAAAPPPASALEFKRSFEEDAIRGEVSSNVAPVQSARRDVQELFKSRNQSSSELADASGAAARAAEAKRVAPAASPQALSSGAASPGASARGSFSTTPAEARQAAVVQAKSESVRAKETPVDRRGWWTQVVDGRTHVIGWVQPAGNSDVRGVEVESVALIGRLGANLPVDTGVGEGFALRDAAGRIMHQTGAIPREGAPLTRIPLTTHLLPGWDVVAFLAVEPPRGAVDGGLLGVGMLLVAIFVAAILAGGSLLLWQARRSEEEAAQKTSFVANVSHEFKTPLTTIRLYAELLAQGRLRDAAQGADYLKTIGRETERLARLVNNALDFSRLEQGKKTFAREPVDLVQELTRLLDTHAPRVAEAGLALRRELPSSPVRVVTDRDAIEQIVLNLIDNACKYAAEGGEVRVLLDPRGGGEVRVADRGPGVPAEHRERIFEKFHRVDDALTAEKTGAGLGLSIARQLARGLGGELRYVPREGGGAEFVLELPNGVNH
jgi:signal transduction histidine kinase